MGEDRGYSGAAVALSFILGGTVGALAALLLAPEPGEQTREKIRGLASSVRGRTSELAEDFREKVEEVLDKGRDALQEKKSILTAAYDAGREAMERERERLAGR
jgi:gas vesicle protein